MLSIDTAGVLAGAALAPSEICYLFGTHFAGKGNAPAPAPHLPDHKDVDIDKLVVDLLAVALLASEQVGALRLELRQGKALFGLRKVNQVFVTATETSTPFFKGSWEAKLYTQAAKSKERTSELANLVFMLVPESTSPFGEVIGLLLVGMNARGLLDVLETTKLKVFHSKRFQLKESTSTLATQQPLDAVKALLNTSQQGRPELHKLLLEGIRRGVSRSEKSDDYGPD
ncbi:MAG: hypothetical protein M1298_05025 [Chloroflexi bacterium]|nr:hypothetical protein [Chloroflexota bacterium]